MTPAYIYKAIVRSVYDGDTMRVDIDCGFNIWQHNVSLRLKGINAPEVSGVERPKGLVSRDWLRAKLPVGTEIVIKTEHDTQEKYGRWLATIYLDDQNINEEMIKQGLAVPFM